LTPFNNGEKLSVFNRLFLLAIVLEGIFPLSTMKNILIGFSTSYFYPQLAQEKYPIKLFKQEHEDQEFSFV
jgi:hypothetical protein